MKQIPNQTILIKSYSVDLLRQNKDILYVFGDNSLRKGCKGQAIIRYHPNSIGVITKLRPSMSPGSFLVDGIEAHRQMVLSDLRRLYKLAEASPQTIVAFPAYGLGTGLAKMRQNCPHLFQEMNSIIETYFGITFPHTL
jgi:hypothetical protein